MRQLSPETAQAVAGLGVVAFVAKVEAVKATAVVAFVAKVEAVKATAVKSVRAVTRAAVDRRVSNSRIPRT